MSGAYYNENDPFAARWLRNLADAGEIMAGTVDDRSIEDVAGDDIRGYRRVHFFAGIAGWDLALRLAGWPDDRHVWTGSCPCQPYSAAGKGEGDDDPRNLWPQFRRLIAECRPPVVLGEQVESQDGRAWLARVRIDMEALEYRFGASDLCAAGLAAPQRRQRLFWVADANGPGHQGAFWGGESGATEGRGSWPVDPGGHGGTGGLGCAQGDGRRQERPQHGGCAQGGREEGWQQRPWDDFDVIACRDGKSRRIESGTRALAARLPSHVGLIRGYGNAIVPQVAAEFIRAYLEVIGTGGR